MNLCRQRAKLPPSTIVLHCQWLEERIATVRGVVLPWTLLAPTVVDTAAAAATLQCVPAVDHWMDKAIDVAWLFESMMTGRLLPTVSFQCRKPSALPSGEGPRGEPFPHPPQGTAAKGSVALQPTKTKPDAAMDIAVSSLPGSRNPSLQQQIPTAAAAAASVARPLQVSAAAAATAEEDEPPQKLPLQQPQERETMRRSSIAETSSMSTQAPSDKLQANNLTATASSEDTDVAENSTHSAAAPAKDSSSMVSQESSTAPRQPPQLKPQGTAEKQGEEGNDGLSKEGEGLATTKVSASDLSALTKKTFYVSIEDTSLRQKVEQAIGQLGGQVLSVSAMKPERKPSEGCPKHLPSHMVLHPLKRTEKFLIACAVGMVRPFPVSFVGHPCSHLCGALRQWIVRPDFVFASKAQSKWVKEEEYEIGKEEALEQKNEEAPASKRQRIEATKEGTEAGGDGLPPIFPPWPGAGAVSRRRGIPACQGWLVLVHRNAQPSSKSLVRILNAGAATVRCVPPYPNPLKLSSVLQPPSQRPPDQAPTPLEDLPHRYVVMSPPSSAIHRKWAKSLEKKGWRLVHGRFVTDYLCTMELPNWVSAEWLRRNKEGFGVGNGIVVCFNRSCIECAWRIKQSFQTSSLLP